MHGFGLSDFGEWLNAPQFESHSRSGKELKKGEELPLLTRIPHLYQGEASGLDAQGSVVRIQSSRS